VATTTFLFTDIAGSTRLWEERQSEMRAALAVHDQVLADAVGRHGGRIFSRMGDGIAAAFTSVADACRAAEAIEQAMAATDHPGVGPLKVRIGIHSGEVEERDGDFFGPAVNRAARIASAAHGGQVLMSDVAARLAPPDAFRLADLGEHRLRDLGQPVHIHQLLVPGVPADFPPVRSLTVVENNLPLQLTSFVGRDRELGQLLDLLEDHRLVTLTGVGGVGKTRVALQAAADVASRRGDGAWFVPLAPVVSDEGVPPAFLEALRVKQTSEVSPTQAVLEHLAESEALVVVDNCEHVIDATARIVADILGSAPRVTILTTSRELLGVPGEVALGLRSLQMPDGPEGLAVSDAGRLLLERAHEVRPGFQAEEHAEALVEICRRLDGVPLAIELAAARLRAFSPERVAALLDEGFRLLTGGSRTAVPRQRTLEAAIGWSHRLLDEAEQRVFRRLAVFGGGFSLEAAHAVCADTDLDGMAIIDLVEALTNKSLIAVSDESEDRFRLLETIRQFAAARLEEAGEADELRRRHAGHYRDVVAEALVERWGPASPTARRRIMTERDNLRQALTWAIEAGEGEIALDLAWGFGVFAREGEWTEPVMWMDRAVDAAGPAPDEATGAVRMHRLAAMVARGPDKRRAIDLWHAAIEVFERLDDGGSDAPWLLDYARALHVRAVVDFYRGEGGEHNERFREQIHRSLEIARRIDHAPLVAILLGNLAHHVDPGEDPDEVRKVFAEAEAAAAEVGDPGELATLRWQRARYELFVGDLEASQRYWKSAVEMAVQAARSGLLPRMQIGLALVELEQGDDTATDRLREAIGEVLETSDSVGVGDRAISQTMLLAVASAAAHRQAWDVVARAIGASDAEAARQVPVPWDLAPHRDGLVAAGRAAVGETAFDRHRSSAREMSPAEIGELLTASW